MSGLDVLPDKVPEPAPSATDALLISFRSYLLSERALAPSTADAYVDRAGRFLAGTGGGVRAGGTTPCW
ncbi:MAG: hypothetical protein ACRD2W_18365 [Acidimicrobiales bacterium]